MIPLLFIGYLELGYMPSMSVAQSLSADGVCAESFYADLMGGIQWGALRVYGREVCYLVKGPTWYYRPLEMFFYANMDLTLGPVVVGIEHLCMHPTICYSDLTPDGLFGGYTRFYVRVGK
jgi:hypothetical protein